MSRLITWWVSSSWGKDFECGACVGDESTHLVNPSTNSSSLIILSLFISKSWTILFTASSSSTALPKWRLVTSFFNSAWETQLSPLLSTSSNNLLYQCHNVNRWHKEHNFIWSNDNWFLVFKIYSKYAFSVFWKGMQLWFFFIFKIAPEVSIPTWIKRKKSRTNLYFNPKISKAKLLSFETFGAVLNSKEIVTQNS